MCVVGQPWRTVATEWGLVKSLVRTKLCNYCKLHHAGLKHYSFIYFITITFLTTLTHLDGNDSVCVDYFRIYNKNRISRNGRVNNRDVGWPCVCFCVGDHYEALCGGGIVCVCLCGWLVTDASLLLVGGESMQRKRKGNKILNK